MFCDAPVKRLQGGNMISFQAANLRIETSGGGRATLWLDAADRSVNVFNRQVMADLGTALDHLAADRSLQVLLVRSAKPSGFAAGADLHEFLSWRAGGVSPLLELAIADSSNGG